MKKLWFSLLFLCLMMGSYAQTPNHQVISTSGNDGEGGGLFLSWTVGESVIATFENNNIVLTQGFQQPLIAPAGLLGDANCDGSVNVLDLISMVNYIMEQNPSPFCFINADVNIDAVISVLDIIGAVNIIMQ